MVQPKIQFLLTAFAYVAAAVAIATASAALTGWVTQTPGLYRIVPGFAPMKINSALGVFAASVGLLAYRHRWPRVTGVIGSALIALGLLSLAQDFLGLEWSIDRLFSVFSGGDTTESMHMAPNTALSHSALGLMMLLAGSFRERPAAELLAALCGIFVTVLTAAAILGYALGLPADYGWSTLSGMSLPTAVALCTLAISWTGLVLQCYHSVSGNARQSMPLILAASIIVCSVALWHADIQREAGQIKATVQTTADSVGLELASSMQELSRSMVRMAKRWNLQNGTSELLWTADAAAYYRDFPGLQAITKIDPATTIRWIYPLAGNAAAIGFRLDTDPVRRQALATATQTGEPAYTDIIELRTGGRGLVMYVPLTQDGKPAGYISAAMRIEEYIGRLLRRPDYRIRILQNGSHPSFNSDTQGRYQTNFAVTSAFTLSGIHWQLEVAPSLHKLRTLSSRLPFILLISGFGIAVMIGFFFRNIYLLKDQEQHLQQVAAQAEAAAHTKSMFLANMSHEIRTPLNGVIGLTQVLADTTLNDNQKELLGTIQRCGKSLLALVNDILDFSKIEAGKLNLEDQAFDLRLCLDEALSLVSPSAREKGLKISCEAGAATQICVRGDSARLRQILLNLLANAIKFTESGFVRLQVDCTALAATSDGDQQVRVQLAVADSGIGLSDEQQARLFQAFSQADVSTTRRFGGTGLGLAISGRIAEAMGGSITVASQVGQGATFTLTLTLAQVPASALPQPAATDLAPDDAAPQAALRILVAEDNAINQRVAKAFLAKLGHTADFVADGREAVLATSAKVYDIVFMDVHMPVMDGIGATRAIMQGEPAARPYIIAMTAGALQEDKDACLNAGMQDYLTKPMTLPSLVAAFQRYYSAAATTRQEALKVGA